MGLFDKKEVLVLKDADSAQKQIDELNELAHRATGPLKSDIENQIRLLSKGVKGEDEILFQLQYSGMDMIILRDLYLVCDDLSAQIDYYIITPWMNFIVECKNLYGNITINNKGDFIRSYQYNGRTVKEGIPSPITQNDRHILVLKKLMTKGAGKLKTAFILQGFDNFTKTIVALSNSKTILNDKYAPKEVKSKVVRADNLVNCLKQYINSSKNIKSSKKDMMEHANYILSLHQNNETDYTARFRTLVEEQEQKAQQKSESQMCPRCGAKLVERNGKRGKFIGCSAFPKCRYTAEIVNKGE